MPDVSFVFTNPRHHLEMMVPVARALERRGLDCQLVSLAEIRGLDTPNDTGLVMRRALPYNLRRRPSVGAGIGHPSGRHFWIRRLAQRTVTALLVPRVRHLLGDSRVIVVANDAAFPYRELIAAVRVPVVLLQEGIRFEFPSGDPYGTAGATKICAWGEGSAELFRARGIAASAIEVTGAPRLDTLDPAAWNAEGRALRERLGLTTPAIALLTNPVETQGFGTRADKLALVERFLDRAEPALRRRGLGVLIKNHPHEDAGEYAAVAARSRLADRTRVVTDASLFAVLAATTAAIVWTSTVGIDALLFGLPLGVLEIPGHGFGFEYVSHGAAAPLRIDTLDADLGVLLDGADARRPAADAFVERHLHARGGAAERVADVVAALA